MHKRISLSRKVCACTNVMVLVPMPQIMVHKPALILMEKKKNMTELDNWVTIEEGVFMKLNTEFELADFLNAVRKAKGNVWLESVQGDKYNLKSTLSRYVAFAALITDHGDELELFCDKREDESLFFEFFYEHPHVLE